MPSQPCTGTPNTFAPRRRGPAGDALRRASYAVNPTEQLHFALSGLPGVEQVRSRFGAADRPAWRVAGLEFAHLHADDLVDLRLPREVQARLKSDPSAHFRAGKSEWLEFEFHSEAEVQHVIALAREAWAAASRSRRTRRNGAVDG
jgi:hypothetical protein